VRSSTNAGAIRRRTLFADPQHGHGLYAVPQSIYKMLDRNRYTSFYDPAARDRDQPKRLLAEAGAKPKRTNPEGSYRSQSPEEELNVPPPGRFGIQPPVLGHQNEAEPERGATKAWVKPNAKLASQPPPETEAFPSDMTRESDDEPTPTPAPSAKGTNPEDMPLPKNSKWKAVRPR